VEIQGLVAHSAFGMVRQKTQGFDPNRLGLLARFWKKGWAESWDKDIF